MEELPDLADLPSPAHMVGENAAQQRARHTGNPVHGSNDAGVDGTFDQWDRVRYYDQGTGENASGTNTSDGSSKDQCN